MYLQVLIFKRFIHKSLSGPLLDKRNKKYVFIKTFWLATPTFTVKVCVRANIRTYMMSGQTEMVKEKYL